LKFLEAASPKDAVEELADILELVHTASFKRWWKTVIWNSNSTSH